MYATAIIAGNGRAFAEADPNGCLAMRIGPDGGLTVSGLWAHTVVYRRYMHVAEDVETDK